MNARVMGAAVVGGVAAAIAIAGVGSSATSQSPAVLTLRVTQDPAAAHASDVSPKGPSAGDVYVYSATLRTSGHVVGRLEGTTTAADPKFQGDVSTQYLVLRDGTVAIVGGGQSGAPGVGRPDDRIYDAIVGGTGRYSGSGGWVSVKNVSDSTELMTLHFTR